MTVIEKYKRAIENSDEESLRQVFAPEVRVEVPAGASGDYPVNTAAHMLSQVAETAPGITCLLKQERASSSSPLHLR
jgi:hypothetical protein